MQHILDSITQTENEVNNIISCIKKNNNCKETQNILKHCNKIINSINKIKKNYKNMQNNQTIIQFSANQIFDTTLTITASNITIHKGSIICKSTNRYIDTIHSKSVKEIRKNIQKINLVDVCVPTGFLKEKFILNNDITVKSVEQAEEFILGRGLRDSDKRILSNNVKD